jgi:hypothetical protein
MADQTGAPNNQNKMPELNANLVNPLDEKTKKVENSTLIKNIVATTTGSRDKNILDNAPELDASILKGVEPPKSIALTILKPFFALLLTASVGSFFFFTSQLGSFFDSALDKFGLENLSADVSTSNAEIIKLQTDLNVNRYLQGKAYLDNFSYIADSYMSNFEIAHSQTASEIDKNLAVEEVVRLRDDLKFYLGLASEKLDHKTYVDLVNIEAYNQKELKEMFDSELRTDLKSMASAVASSDSSSEKSDYKNYLQTLNLIGNDKLGKLIISTDFDAMDDGEVYEFAGEINSLIVNDLSIIQAIKAQRIKWSDMMNEIELRTITVDNHYSDDFYNELGGIRYTSYDFDTANRKITIVGETKRFDTRNFTMIADLIDELNRSGILDNGEMRSFSKSGSLDSGYTATLKLALDIIDQDFANQDFLTDILN